MTEQETLLRRAAIDLLARREHSRRELSNKLRSRADSTGELETVLDKLEQDDLLSNARFVEAFVRSRANSGYGPVRIRQELQQKGINGESIYQSLEELGADWYEIARESRCKKFGSGLPVDNRDRNRQMRYLQYRGFDMDIIRAAMVVMEE